jgi:surfeit locus 1 family protein
LPPARAEHRRSGRPTLAGALLSLAGLVILVWLGGWQLQRLAWKENLIRHIAALKSEPARPLAQVLAQGDLDFVRVRFDCPDLMSRPRLRLYGVQAGATGYRLMTACPISAGAASSVLVDLGFERQSLSEDTPKACLQGRQTALSGPVTGVLRLPDKANFVTPPNQPAQNLWFSRDLAAMAAALGQGTPTPAFVALETAPGAADTTCPLTPTSLPSDLPNNHLAYAITWFGLAAALVGVYVAMLFRRRPE